MKLDRFQSLPAIFYGTQNTMSQIQYRTTLEIRSVSALKGKFRIPSYQRGYRWERRQVRQLLEDLNDHMSRKSQEPYYLQPIVVAPLTGHDDNPEMEISAEQTHYDLIDGQQRLTTILLILKYLDHLSKLPEGRMLASIVKTPQYSIYYQTRESTQTFLDGIVDVKAGDPLITETPDHLYMWHAYQEIADWMEKHPAECFLICNAIDRCVKVIWYELPPVADNEKKFTDLNIGKIPLTSSELIKAMILQNDNKLQLTEYEQQTIISQWDQIERELHEGEFWGFLTNHSMQNMYANRIDLLFDLIVAKPDDGDKDYTFRHFYNTASAYDTDTRSGKHFWDDIYLKYQRLRDWYNDRDLYHKIGFLVTVGCKGEALRELFGFTFPEEGNPKSEDEVKIEVDRRVRDAVAIDKGRSLEELDYNDDSNLIYRILTLYNVMLCQRVNDDSMRYSFKSHNSLDTGWTLEHIHAQNSQGLKTANDWRDWVESHLDSMTRFRRKLQGDGDEAELSKADKLISDMRTYLAGKPTGGGYNDISIRYSELMDSHSNGASRLYKDSMGNMALLCRASNSMLNNSSFDVKRERISAAIATYFVPIGTQRVFMKTIKGCETESAFYWSQKDREAYLADIERVIGNYL